MAKAKVKCKVFTKIVGYCRELSSWNVAKRQELQDRKLIGDNR